MSRALLAALSAILITCGFATRTSGQVIAITEPPLIYLTHGVRCAPTDVTISTGHDTVDGEVISVTGDDASNGYLVETAQVPALIGISFGTRVDVARTARPTTLWASLTHPPMGPDEITEQNWPINIIPGQGLAVEYVIEDPFEQVPGIWTFRVYAGADRVLERSFKLFAEGGLPELEALCLPS